MIIPRLISLIVEALVEELARQWLPQPPAPERPTPEQRRETWVSESCGRLWDRYRDPEGSAILFAASLEEADVRWLTMMIREEHREGPDTAPLTHEVFDV